MTISTVKAAKDITGGLSGPSKMPGPSWGTPTEACNIGSRLREIPGSTCFRCYAHEHGAYRWPVVKAAYQRRLEGLSHPDWTEAMIFLVARQAAKSGVMRWDDSGDIQGIDHLRMIVAVAKGTPEIKHWLPTREYPVITEYLDNGEEIPPNLTIRLSAHMNDRVPPLHLAARHPQVVVSGVAEDDPVPEGSWECPAPKQGNECGSCRACWDADVEWVTYHYHY